MLRIPLAFALVLSPLVHEASADVERVLENEVQHYQIRLPANSVDLAPSTGIFSASRLGAMTMTLSRIDGTNIRAYRRHDEKQFISEVLAGVLRNPELTLTSNSTIKNSKPPILDLKLLRAPKSGKKEVVWMRLLFFRRYTIVASAAVPSKQARNYQRQAKRFTNSLVRWIRN